MFGKYVAFYKKYLYQFFSKQLVGGLILFIYAMCSGIYPWFLQKIIDEAILQSSQALLIRYTLYMLGVIILSIVFKYLKIMYYFELGKQISFEIKNRLLKDLMTYNEQFFKKYKTPELVSILEQDVATVQTLFITVVNDLFSSLVTFILLVVLMGLINFKLTVISLSLIGIYVFLQSRYGKRVKAIAYEISKQRGAFSSLSQEVVDNIRHIQLMGEESFFMECYNQSLGHFYELSEKKTRQNAAFSVVDGGFEALNLIVILFVGGLLVLNNELEVGALFTLTLYVQKVFSPVLSMMGNYMEFKRIQASLDRIMELSDQEAYRLVVGSRPVKEKGPFSHDLELMGLSFGYSKERLFESANLLIPLGEKVLFWGENGVGKSTLLKLIMKQQRPEKGCVTLGGVPTEELDESYFRQVCLLPQNPFIFRGSIRENLLMGRRDLSEEQIERALTLVNFLQDIRHMEKGLDTMVGQGGVALSGGQAQKLALARVFLNDKSRIFILDEPTAALDPVSAKVVLENLFSHKKEDTILLIAHQQEVQSYCNYCLKIEAKKLLLDLVC